MNSPELGRAQLHIHTEDGDGLASIKSLLETAVKLGMNVIAITDHDQIRQGEKAKNLAIQKNYPLEVITGIEITASLSLPFGHVLGLFPQEPPTFTRANMFMGIKETVDWIHQNKGLAILPHPHLSPFWLNNPQSAKIFDGIEVVSPAPRVIRENLQGLKGKVAFLRGGDIHYVNDPRWGYLTLFPGVTAADLVEAIKNKQTVPTTENFNLPPPSPKDIFHQLFKAIVYDPFKTARLMVLIPAAIRSF